MKNKSPSTRLRYLSTWMKRPMAVAGIMLIPVLFCVTLALSFPCGKFSHPVSRGMCDNGNSFISPLEGILIGTVIGVVGVIAIGMSEPYSDNKSIVRSFVLDLSNSPKWWKRWYIPTFITIYIPVAVVWYVLFKDEGLYWYNYIGQYALILPMITVGLTAGVMTAVRGRLRRRSK